MSLSLFMCFLYYILLYILVININTYIVNNTFYPSSPTDESMNSKVLVRGDVIIGHGFWEFKEITR